VLARAVLLALPAALCGVGCSFDWDGLDPRGGTSTSATSTGPGGSGGTLGTGGGGQGGSMTSTSSQGGGGVGGNTGGMGGAGGQGGSPLEIGCSDGTRELYDDALVETSIAGCSGAWNVPGLSTSQSMAPQCNRQAGNDGVNSAGSGCSVEDLCAAGWTVCPSSTAVAAAASDGACPTTGPTGLWITRQGGMTVGTECMDGGLDDLIGCGFGIGKAAGITCAPLDRTFLHSDCTTAASWDCGDVATYQTTEHLIVTKPGLSQGGVLCCRSGP
jgi:hypothetical protein